LSFSAKVSDQMASEQQQVVLFTVADGIARITLNRPDKRNALNDAVIGALKDALRLADQDQRVRAVILEGAGADFCSGADLAALQKISNASVAENLEDARSLLELFTLIRQVHVPVIAAVKGRALAGGCGLATACDIVLAARSARFGYPEVRLGFIPAMVMAMLRRSVSEKRAFELVTLGAEFSAEEAVGFGLVNHVFDDEEFPGEVEKFAGRFEKVSRSAVSLSKQLLYQIDGMSFESALDSGADMNVIARMTADCRKGVAAFLKKR
jgi:methylglutaconyl-CoA hydratase